MMEFEGLKTYRNKHQIDIDMLVVAAHTTELGFHLMIYWLNRHKNYLITKDEVFVNKKHLHDWKEVK